MSQKQFFPEKCIFVIMIVVLRYYDSYMGPTVLTTCLDFTVTLQTFLFSGKIRFDLSIHSEYLFNFNLYFYKLPPTNQKHAARG